MIYNSILLTAQNIVSDSIAVKNSAVMSSLKAMTLDDLLNKVINGAINFGLRLLIAIAVFYIGRFIIHKIYKIAHTVMVRREIEPSLASFLLSLLKIVLMFILIVTIVGILGIETSSFVAIFASAGVAIGLALSGTLQNFAGGVLILLIKPYKVGDVIEFGGMTGTVKEIQIFSTIINTIDNKTIIIPNGGLSTGTINNYSTEYYRRVEWVVGISYGDDFDTAKKILTDILDSDERVVKKSCEEDYNNIIGLDSPSQPEREEMPNVIEKKGLLSRLSLHKKKLTDSSNWDLNKIKISYHAPQGDCSPTINLSELADSSVNIKIRAWVRTENYWNVFFDINERIYKEFPKNGLSFPFPQLDVHLDK